MLEWLIYNTMLPLIPAPIVWGLSQITESRKKRMFEILKDGQLCFYCTVTGAILVKDLIAPGGPGLDLLLLGGLLLVLIFSTASYFVGVVLSDDINESGMGWMSLGTAALTTALVLAVRSTEGLL